jgi:hypothetical protein
MALSRYRNTGTQGDDMTLQAAIEALVKAHGTQAVLKAVTTAHEKTPGACRLPSDWRDIINNEVRT